jgi:hypothetical protein
LTGSTLSGISEIALVPSTPFPRISECALSPPVDVCLPLLPSWLRRWASRRRGERTLERWARSRSRNLHFRVGATPQACLSTSRVLPNYCSQPISPSSPSLPSSPLFICPSVCRLIYLATSPERSISAVVLIRMLAGNLARSIKLAHAS